MSGQEQRGSCRAIVIGLVASWSCVGGWGGKGTPLVLHLHGCGEQGMGCRGGGGEGNDVCVAIFGMVPISMNNCNTLVYSACLAPCRAPHAMIPRNRHSEALPYYTWVAERLGSTYIDQGLNCPRARVILLLTVKCIGGGRRREPDRKHDEKTVFQKKSCDFFAKSCAPPSGR